MAKNRDSKKSFAWQHLVAATSLVAGLGLIAWSFLVPSESVARQVWSQDHARKYQSTSAKLHGLSHEFVHQAQRGNEQAVRAKLDKAQAEYDVLRTQLESAMARPRQMILLLRFGGVLLAVGGAAILYWMPKPGRE